MHSLAGHPYGLRNSACPPASPWTAVITPPAAIGATPALSAVVDGVSQALAYRGQRPPRRSYGSESAPQNNLSPTPGAKTKPRRPLAPPITPTPTSPHPTRLNRHQPRHESTASSRQNQRPANWHDILAVQTILGTHFMPERPSKGTRTRHHQLPLWPTLQRRRGHQSDDPFK